MSEISTDKITPRIKSATKITQIDSASKFPTGMVLNVQQALKTDVQTITNSSGSFPDWQDITGLSVTMTPKSASSKFFIQYVLCVQVNIGKYMLIY